MAGIEVAATTGAFALAIVQAVVRVGRCIRLAGTGDVPEPGLLVRIPGVGRHRVVDGKTVQRRHGKVADVVEVGAEDGRLIPVGAAVEDGGLGRPPIGDQEVVDPVAVEVSAVGQRHRAGGAGDDRVVVAEQVDVALPGSAATEQQVDTFLGEAAAVGRAGDRDGQIVLAVIVVVAAGRDDDARPRIVHRGWQECAGQTQGDRAGVEGLIAGGVAAEMNPGQAVDTNGGVDLFLHRRDEVGITVGIDIAERNQEGLIGEVARHQVRVGLPGRNLDAAAEFVAEAELVAAGCVNQVGRAQACRQLQDTGRQGVGRDDLERRLAGEAAVDQAGQDDTAACVLAGLHFAREARRAEGRVDVVDQVVEVGVRAVGGLLDGDRHRRCAVDAQ